MTAVRVEAPRTARAVAAPTPEPAAGEVLVRVEGCGVCGSSRPLWEGRPWFEYPLEPGAPGHEGWGTIEAVGEGVGGLSPGERVAFVSYHAFAELDVAEARACVPLPDALDGRPFPGEALGCAVNVLRRSDVRPGQRVAIVGIGFLGAALVQLCATAGADVVAFSRRLFGRELACTLGARSAAGLADPADGTFERVIEAAGVQETLDFASRLTAERGRLVVAGYHQDAPRTVDMQLWNWRGIDVVNAHERDLETYAEGIRGAVDAVLADRLDLDRLVTHRLPLTRADEAFELARTRPDGFVKAVVEP